MSEHELRAKYDADALEAGSALQGEVFAARLAQRDALDQHFTRLWLDFALHDRRAPVRQPGDAGARTQARGVASGALAARVPRGVVLDGGQVRHAAHAQSARGVSPDHGRGPVAGRNRQPAGNGRDVRTIGA